MVIKKFILGLIVSLVGLQFSANGMQIPPGFPLKTLTEKSPAAFKSVDKKGNTHLHNAVLTSYEAVKELADILDDATFCIMDVHNNDGFTPLHLAVKQIINNNKIDSSDIFELLVKKGLNINSQAMVDSSTCLHLAAGAGFDLLLARLLYHGAQRNLQDIQGFTPLHRAAYYDRLYSVRLLLNNQNKDLTDFNGRTALCIAAAKSRLKSLGELIKFGANKDIQDKQGDSAMHYTVSYDQLNSLQMLLDAGANTELKNQEGYTPQQIADKWHPKAAEILRKHEIKNKEQGQDDSFFVMYAADEIDLNTYYEKSNLKKLVDPSILMHLAINSKQANKDKVAKIEALLVQGADIESLNSQGLTALQSSVALGNLRLIKLFVENNAQVTEDIDITIKRLIQECNNSLERNFNNDIKNRLNKFLEIQEYFNKNVESKIEASTDVSTSSSRASVDSASGSSPAVTDFVVKTQEDIRELNRRLFQVLLNDNKSEKQIYKKVNDLILAGATVNSVYIGGGQVQPVLHLAAFKYFERVIELLIDNGADVTQANNMGDTVLHVVCFSEIGISIDGMRKILDAYNGASIDTVNNEDHTPLLSLICGDNPDLEKVKLLVEEYKADINVRIENHDILEIIEDKIDTLEKFESAQEKIDELSKIEQYFILKFKELSQSASSTKAVNVEELNQQLFEVLWDETKTENQIYRKVKTLLLKGAQATAVDRSENGLLNTPLHYVAGFNRFESVVDLLLDNGADINALNEIRANPLMYSFVDEKIIPKLQFVRLLVEKYHSRFDICFRNQLNIIQCIDDKIQSFRVTKASEEIRELIEIKKYFVNKFAHKALSSSANSSSSSSVVTKPLSKLDKKLLKAAQDGKETDLIEALAKGSDINAKGEAGYTALGLAIFFDHIHIVEILLNIGSDNGIDLEASQSICGNALNMAIVKQKSSELITLLFNAGLSVNLKNMIRQTAFCNAIIYDRLDIVNLFLPKVDFSVKHSDDENIVEFITRIIMDYASKCKAAASEEVKNILKSRMLNYLTIKQNIIKLQSGLKK